MDGAMILIPLMGIIWPMVALIVFMYLYFSSRNKIRMALIESGRDASIFRSRRKVDRLRTLKTGIICLMVGVGFLLGFAMQSLAGLPEEVAYFAGIFICVGGGLVAFYLYLHRLPLPQEEAEMV